LTGVSNNMRAAYSIAIVVLLAGLSACAERTPEVKREVLGLDASGRPVVSFTQCDHYGLAGNLGSCFRETPPVVWCYRTLGERYDCFDAPDRYATRAPAPTVDVPLLPTLYALPSPRLMEASPPVEEPDMPIPAPPGKVDTAPPSAPPANAVPPAKG
jgi:hypothetical protein